MFEVPNFKLKFMLKQTQGMFGPIAQIYFIIMVNDWDSYQILR